MMALQTVIQYNTIQYRLLYNTKECTVVDDAVLEYSISDVGAMRSDGDVHDVERSTDARVGRTQPRAGPPSAQLGNSGRRYGRASVERVRECAEKDTLRLGRISPERKIAADEHAARRRYRTSCDRFYSSAFLRIQ